MAIETRQKQSRHLSRPEKASSARRKSISGRVSGRKPARRTQPRTRARSVSTASEGLVPAPVNLAREQTVKNFGTAVRHFQKKDYEKAAVLFRKVAEGPVREVADRARVHLRYCERQRQHEKRPKTAEGYYARGVAALNSRDFDLALHYLGKCNKMVPDQEYVHYALAAAYGLQGNPDQAFVHLETAIRLRPQNRVQARHDEDFQGLTEDPRFSQLLGSDAPQPSN